MHRRMLALLVAFVVTALLAGCADGSSDDRQTDYRWSFSGPPEARQAFAEALEEWNACGVVDGRLLPPGDESGVKVFEGAPHGDAIAETTNAAHRPVSIVYKADPRLRYVFAHELGHALRGTGEHTKGGLMNERLLHEEQPVDCSWIE